MEELINKVESMLTLPIDKFPYLQIQKDSVETLKNLIELLNKRNKFLKSHTEDITDYQANENKISIIKTEIELAKLHTQVIQKEKTIKEYVESITEYLKEIEKEWDSVIAKANIKSKNDKVVAEIIEQGSKQDFTKNYEYKIAHYIQLKNAINPKLKKVK
jgi:hypothetical protein